jgi:hypothetical protein
MKRRRFMKFPQPQKQHASISNRRSRQVKTNTKAGRRHHGAVFPLRQAKRETVHQPVQASRTGKIRVDPPHRQISMKLSRRKFPHAVAGAAAVPALAPLASASDYPSRPVHLVIG